MTTQIIEGTDVEEETFLPPPPPLCDGNDAQGNDCTELAVFKTHVACCGTIFFFCEDCLILTMQSLKMIAPDTHSCRVCDTKISEPDKHLIFDGRL